jgi:hypothetical protein
MTFGALCFLRRSITLLASGAAVGLLACSSPDPEPSQAIISSNVTRGSNLATDCNISSTQWVTIGDFGNENATPPVLPTPIADKGSYNGNGVNVTCSVTRDGDGYQVTASAQINGPDGGSISVTGHFTQSGDQKNINMIFARADYGTYTEMDCTVSYAGRSVMGVAPGRVWATAVCEHVTNNTETTPRICRGQTEFRFENCAQ